MTSVVAETTFWAQCPGDEPFRVHLQIGTPYQVGASPDEWACPVSLKPLIKQLRDAHGESSFQAMCLASALALEHLNAFKEQGGTLFYSPGQAVPLEAYSFGIASRSTSSGV